MVKQGDNVHVLQYDHIRNRYPVEVGVVESIAGWLPWSVKVVWQDGSVDFFEENELEVVER